MTYSKQTLISSIIVAFVIGLLIGTCLVLFIIKVFNIFGDNFISKNDKANDIHNKVSYMFNNNTENYNEFKDKLQYGDAVLYNDLKTLKKSNNNINPDNIINIL